MNRVLALVSVAVAATAASASAAPQADLLIRPGVGIGKLRLGMTQSQLRRAAGKPNYVVPRGRTFGLVRVEYQYGLGAEYIATLVGRPGRLRVTRVSTIVRRERTPKGIGPGSLERTLLRVHPTAQCTPLRMESYKGIYQYLATLDRSCTIVAPSGRRTIFRTAWPSPAPHVRASIRAYLRYARVIEVVVAGPASG